MTDKRQAVDVSAEDDDFWIVPLPGGRYMAADNPITAKNFAIGASVSRDKIIHVRKVESIVGKAEGGE